MDNFSIKIKTSIIAVFTVIIIFIVGTIMFIQYKSSNEFALLTTQKVFNRISDNVIHQIQTYDIQSHEFIKLAKKIKGANDPVELNKRHTLLPIITEYINDANYVYGIYMGYKDNSFYIIYNLDLSQRMREAQKAPKEARWLIKKNIQQNGKFVSYKEFVDKDFKTVLTLKEDTTYQPTQRPWYKNSIKTDHMIKTKPYIFSAVQEPGVTYAQLVDSKEKGTILSLDITLSSLSKLLAKQSLVEGSAAFIFKEDGKLIGQFDQISNTNIKNLNEQYKDTFIKDGKVLGLEKQELISINGKEYLRYTTLLKSNFNTKDYLTILSPIDIIMKPYKDKIYQTLGITALILVLVVIPVIFMAVRLIVKPILQLEKENKKIEEGRFEDVEHVNSFMIEIASLSGSLVNMSNAIEEKTNEITQLLASFDKNVIASKTDTKGNIIYASEAFCKISGYEQSELIGKPQNIVRHPDTPSSVFKGLWETIKSGKVWRGEIKNSTKDGSFYWVEALISPDYDKNGKLLGYSAIRQDITSKKEVEELTENLEIKIEKRTAQLAQEKENVEQILANILLPVLITSKERRTVVYANKFAQDLYDSNEENMIEKPLDSVYTLTNGPERIIKQITETGRVNALEEAVTTHTGKEFIALLSVTPISYNGEDCYIGMTVDITEQKEMENEVRRIHQHTRESIEYASLIQSAVLPDNNLFRKYFDDYFVVWHPKDTVGGDIYFFEELRHDEECLLFFIDCTGHGVPGAFVTMLVKAVERQIIADIMADDLMEVSPAWIMSYFNKSLKKLLKQDNPESVSNAGWDGGIIYYNKKEKILKFAGAETPLFYVTADGEFKTIKGNRYSVGYKKCDIDYQYKETIIQVEEGMKFYCTTDGYLDQNGGEKDFPFGKKRFGNIIKEFHPESMAEQQEMFLYEMDTYESMIENNDRNDDMTVIGFTI